VVRSSSACFRIYVVGLVVAMTEPVTVVEVAFAVAVDPAFAAAAYILAEEDQRGASAVDALHNHNPEAGIRRVLPPLALDCEGVLVQVWVPDQGPLGQEAIVVLEGGGNLA
jgi:hypothetical protein